MLEARIIFFKNKLNVFSSVSKNLEVLYPKTVDRVQLLLKKTRIKWTILMLMVFAGFLISKPEIAAAATIQQKPRELLEFLFDNVLGSQEIYSILKALNSSNATTEPNIKEFLKTLEALSALRNAQRLQNNLNIPGPRIQKVFPRIPMRKVIVHQAMANPEVKRIVLLSVSGFTFWCVYSTSPWIGFVGLIGEILLINYLM